MIFHRLVQKLFLEKSMLFSRLIISFGNKIVYSLRYKDQEAETMECSKDLKKTLDLLLVL